MDSIEELIKYHQESNFLDFKQEEYSKEKNHELIKDLIATANADYIGDRYIIIGIKKENEKINTFNIQTPKDSASIQQLVHSKINPELRIEYNPFQYDGKNLMILKVINPTEQPYEVKGNLKFNNGKSEYRAGSMFIKKGSFTLPISRNDLERIYNSRNKKEVGFDDKVQLVFTFTNTTEIDIQSIKNLVTPSQSSINYIQNLLEERLKIEKDEPTRYANIFRYNHSEKALEQYRNEELQKLLPEVYNILKYADQYYLGETTAFKLQLTIINNHNIHLKNVLLKVSTILNYNGMNVIKSTPQEIYVRNHIKTHSPIISKDTHSRYPEIYINDDGMEISQPMKEVKHQLPTFVFDRSIRMYFEEKLIGEEIDLFCELYAENLPNTMKFKLKINII